MDSWLQDELDKRTQKGTIRSLSFFEDGFDFISNDYLGLSRHTSVENDCVIKGSTGSRLMAGNSLEAEECERDLQEFFRVQGALVFNSGYAANVGFWSSVPRRGDLILFDEHVHSSMKDGARLSQATMYYFKHNDLNSLKAKLEKFKGRVFVGVEALYSMHGDIAPIAEIIELKKQVDFHLVVDEAHSCGVVGEHGRGLVNELGLEKEVFARIITFGKAYGFHGAAVLGSEILRSFLINFARSFIYTTALPPKDYRIISGKVRHPEIPQRMAQLKQNIETFRQLMNDRPLSSSKFSPIQMLNIGDVKRCHRIAHFLQENGLQVKAIISPTVKEGEEGIRISLHSFNSSTEMIYLSEKIHQAFALS